jgi:hypothetical protein
MLPVGLLAGIAWGLRAREAYAVLRFARSVIVLKGSRTPWTLRWDAQPLGTIEPSYALLGLLLRRTTIRARDDSLVCTQRLPLFVPESPWRRDCCGEFWFPDGGRQEFVVNALHRTGPAKREGCSGDPSRRCGPTVVLNTLTAGVRASDLLAWPPAAETTALLPELEASATAGASENRALLVFAALWARIAWA